MVRLLDKIDSPTDLKGLSQQQIYERFGRPDDIMTSYSRFVGRKDTWTYKHHNGKLVILFTDKIVTDTFYH